MNSEIDPLMIALPQGNNEKLRSLLFKALLTKEEREVSLDDVRTYIEKETAFYEKYYPPKEARYKKNIEDGRRQAARMEQLFDSGNYLPLIKIIIDRAVREWRIAERRDESEKEWSSVEKEALKEAKEFNDEEEAKVIAKEKAGPKYREEHGMPPEVFELGGEGNRRESERLVRFAVVLARATV